MQEDHLRNDESTTDLDDGSTRSGSQLGDPNPNVDFAVDKFEDMSSTDMSDPAVQDLVQFLSKQSGSISREIDSALTSTDEDDEDSFKRSGQSSDRSFDASRAAESDTLVAAARSKVADPKHDIKKLNEKVRLLLTDRKIQKETIDAQQAELVTLRAALSSKTAGTNESFESAVHKSELSEADRKLVAANQTIAALRSDADDKTDLIVRLEKKIEGLVHENDNQMQTIESQNAKIAKLTDASFSFSGTPSAAAAKKEQKLSRGSNGEVNTFEDEFAALDAALGEIDSGSRSTISASEASVTKRGDDSATVRELNAKLAQRDDEIASLNHTVKRLETLAFEQQSRTSQSSDADASAQASQIRFLQATSDEQARTIQLQKSTIGSLKEEVELLTRQLNDHQNDNQVNVDKQKKVSHTLRKEQERLAMEADKLERDKQEFIQHLKEFKELRREVLSGALVTTGGGVSKTRYRTLRHKRDKYKRKDYRKGKDMNAMQKRLLQNVELLEVEDSQSSSDTTGSGADGRSQTHSQTPSQSQSHSSVHLVQDTSSEAGDEE